MSFYGRSKPYPTQSNANHYNCGRCGIERNRNGASSSGYCADCSHYARADGWAPPLNRGTN